jgi:hypothetical protein
MRCLLNKIQWRAMSTVKSPWETLATDPDLRRLRRRKREELDEGNLLQSSVQSYGWAPITVPAGTSSNNRHKHRKDTVTAFAKQQAEALMSGACDGTLPFQLEVRPSGIAGGGDGLFLASRGPNKQGGVKRGQAVTLYGGRVFVKDEIDHFGTGALVAMIEEGQRSHILGKAGGDCVDGFTHEGLRVTAKDLADTPVLLYALKDRQQQQQQQYYDHNPSNQRFPFALGHMSNHCPDGQPPNLVGWGVNYDIDFYKDELQRGNFDAPNTFALELEGGRVGMPLPCPSSIVMMATRDIEAGEELFQDYGFENSPPTPPWFQPAGLLHDLDNPPNGDEMHEHADAPRGVEAEAAKEALAEWRTAFNKTHGRSPNREDMDRDPIARSLFEAFRRK